MSELSKEFDNFTLYFIGDMDAGYNNWFMSEKEKHEIGQIFREAKWIKYYARLNNADILNLIRECHIGLLPTLGDTFGFSVLEMQSMGCPVITTNRMALPEINDGEKGWVINTKKIELRHGDDYGRYDNDTGICKNFSENRFSCGSRFHGSERRCRPGPAGISEIPCILLNRSQ